MALSIKRIPRISKGIPTGKVITNTISTKPTIANARPITAATRRPVSFNIQVSNRHTAINGHQIQHADFVSFVVSFSNFYLSRCRDSLVGLHWKGGAFHWWETKIPRAKYCVQSALEWAEAKGQKVRNIACLAFILRAAKSQLFENPKYGADGFFALRQNF